MNRKSRKDCVSCWTRVRSRCKYDERKEQVSNMRRSRLTRALAYLLVLVLLPIGTVGTGNAQQLEQKVFTDEQKSYEIVVEKTQSWDDKYTANVAVKNTGKQEIKNWVIRGTVDGTISNIWNAEQLSKDENQTVISYKNYNRSIPVGEQIEFGMQVEGGTFDHIEQLTLSEEKQDVTEQCEVSFQLKNNWEKHAILEATLHNTGDSIIRDWKVLFSLKGTISNIWNADVLADKEGQYVIGSKNYNAQILPKKTVTFGFEIVLKEDDSSFMPENSSVYAVVDTDKAEDAKKGIDWYKSMIHAEDDVVLKARDNVKDTVKVAMLDSGVDFTQTINVEERQDFTDCDSEEENPLWDDLTGHGTGVAGLIVSDKEKAEEDTEEEETTEEDVSDDISIRYMTKLDEIEGEEIEAEPEDLQEEVEEDDDDEDIELPFDDAKETTEEDDTTEDAEQEENPYAINDQYGEIEGLNKNIELYSGRVLDENNEAPISRVIEGIKWAMEKKVHILHISWGTNEDNEQLHRIIKQAYKQGMLIIAPAGNEGSVMYPAKYKEVVAVNSVNSQGYQAENAASGEAVELAAPGEDVTVYTSFGILEKQSGTSYAAPQVTSLAAILWQQDITKSNEFIRQLMDVTASPLGEKNQYGYGLVNYKKAVETYHDFESIYQECNDLDQNEGLLLLEDKQTDGVDAIDVLPEGYVKGLWDHHDKIINKGMSDNLKKGLKWPDKSQSKLKGKSKHPNYHGGSDSVSAYLWLMEKGKEYWNTGKWNWDTSKEREKNLQQSLNRCYVTKEGAVVDFGTSSDAIDQSLAAKTIYAIGKDSDNKQVQKASAQFVMGMAMHTLGDLFSHKSYGLKEKTKEYTKLKDFPKVYTNIMHGVKQQDVSDTKKVEVLGANYQPRTYFDNRADCPKIAVERYWYTAKLYENILKKVVRKSQKRKFMPSVQDYISAKPPMVKKNQSLKTRKAVLKNCFGIKGLAKQLVANGLKETSATKQITKRLDNLDLKRLLKQFHKWEYFKFEFADNVKVSDIRVYKVKGTSVGSAIIPEKVSNKEKYAFIGDVDQKYVVSVKAEKNNETVYAMRSFHKKGACKSRSSMNYITVKNVYSNEKYNTKDIVANAPKCDERKLFGINKIKFTKGDYQKRFKYCGVVKDAETKDTLANAVIQLKYKGRNRNYEKEVKTNKEGVYAFEGRNALYPGEYKMVAYKEGYKKEFGEIIVYNQKDPNAKKNGKLLFLQKNRGGQKGKASGCIKDAKTGKRVGGLQLNLRKGFGVYDTDVIATIPVKEDGTYITSNLESGYYTAEIVDNREVDENERYLKGYMEIQIIEGKITKNQNGVVTKTLDNNQIRIVLTWGASPSDLDSHLLGTTQDGVREHVSYRRKVITNDNGDDEMALDVDDRDGYGPETITIYNPSDDDYHFYVHNYSHNNRNELMQSGAVVQVYKGGLNTPWQIFYVPQEKGYFWDVFSYDAENDILTPHDKITSEEPD